MWIMILADLEDILSNNSQKYHVKSKNAFGDILFLKSQGWKQNCFHFKIKDRRAIPGK